MKNFRKGNADVVLLVILIILVCGVGGYLIWMNMSKTDNQLSTQTTNQETSSSPVTTQNTNNSTINNNSSNQNVVTSNLNNDTTTNNNNTSTITSIPVLSEDEAIRKIERLYSIIASAESAVTLLYGTENRDAAVDILYNKNNDGTIIPKGTTDDGYIITDISYSDFKAKVHQFISEDLYNSKNRIVKSPDKVWTKEVDGKLAVGNFGLSGYGFDVDKVIIKSQSDGLYRVQASGLAGNVYVQYMDVTVTFKYTDGNYMIVEADNTDLTTYNQIARNLFDKKLLVDVNYSLEEYTIDEVVIFVPDGKESNTSTLSNTIVSGNEVLDRIKANYQDIDNKIFASITYSVKPTKAHFDEWLARNGTEEGDWIQKKETCIVIDKISNSIIQDKPTF